MKITDGDSHQIQQKHEKHFSLFLSICLFPPPSFTLNISKLAALSLSSIRELERGLEASLSDKTMMSGEGVSLPRSGSLDKIRKKLRYSNSEGSQKSFKKFFSTLEKEIQGTFQVCLNALKGRQGTRILSG